MDAIKDIMEGRIATLFAGFVGDRVRVRFKQLAKVIHPDINRDPRASDAFARLTSYAEALERDPSHVEPDAKIIHVHKGGRTFISAVSHRYRGDLGEDFVLKASLMTKFDVLADAKLAKSRVEAFNGVLTGSLEDYAHVLPSAVFEFDDNCYAFARRPETGSLRRVVEAWGNWEPRHAAWLMSALMDFACLMDNQKMTHCALTPENVFVDLAGHSVQVIGGWAFSTARGSRIARLPAFVHSACSSTVLAGKKAIGAIDVAAAKKLVLFALGDQYNATPPAFKAWVSTGVDPDSAPVEEYKKWESVRGAAFGPRKFIKHDKVAADAYKEK